LVNSHDLRRGEEGLITYTDLELPLDDLFRVEKVLDAGAEVGWWLTIVKEARADVGEVLRRL
jgi:hypothetical protein